MATLIILASSVGFFVLQISDSQGNLC